VATEALERIAALYRIEKEIRGRPPDQPQGTPGTVPAAAGFFRQWFEAPLHKLSRKSDTPAAIRYALTRWTALTGFCDDGIIETDNDAAERALRGVALGRKN
jgi:hypothetical protein